MIKGGIYKGRNTIHPIVFLREENSDKFIGCIITHATQRSYKNNIGLRKDHFETCDKNGKDYEILFEQSYFVKLSLEKKNDWGPFVQKGKLTSEGMEYIENYLKEKESISWRVYMQNR